jgi:nucleoside 2-deoxyribosyltransferase
MSQDKTCFVISEIKEDRKHYSNIFFEYIVEKELSKDFKIKRADKIAIAGSIYDDIIENLENADLVIADLTELNSNVLYELGIRKHTGKPVIQFIQDINTLPFNIKNIRTIEYKIEISEVEEARKELRKFVDNIDFKAFSSNNLSNLEDIKTFISEEFSRFSMEIAKTQSEKKGTCFHNLLSYYKDTPVNTGSMEIEKLRNSLNSYIKDGFQATFKYTDVEALANVFTPEGVVTEYEDNAEEIWIATTKLDKDIKDPEIKDVVRKNLENGKKYIYFIPKTTHVNRNIGIFKKEFKDYHNQYHFVILPKESIPLFEEIAIYNPNADDTENIRGLSMTTIDDREAFVYVRLSISQVKRYVEKLKKLMKHGEIIENHMWKLKDDFLDDMSDLKKRGKIDKILTTVANDPYLTRSKYRKVYDELTSAFASDRLLKQFKNDVEPHLYEDIDYSFK